MNFQLIKYLYMSSIIGIHKGHIAIQSRYRGTFYILLGSFIFSLANSQFCTSSAFKFNKRKRT